MVDINEIRQNRLNPEDKLLNFILNYDLSNKIYIIKKYNEKIVGIAHIRLVNHL